MYCLLSGLQKLKNQNMGDIVGHKDELVIRIQHQPPIL